MSKSSTKPLVDSGEHSEKIKMEPHLRFFLILNAIVGHSFAIKVLGIKRPSLKFYLFYTNFAVCHLLLFGYSLAIFAHMYGSLEELEKFDRKIENLAFTACGSFGIFLVLARICCMVAQDSKITKLFKRTVKLEEQIISAAAKNCLIAVLIISLIICSVMIAGAVAGLNMKSTVFNNSTTYQFNTTDDKTWQFMEASPHHRDMFRKFTPTSFTLYIFIAHATGTFLTVKYILAETYDFYFYFIIISLYTRVRDSATEAVSSGCPLKIERWLEEHQECCRFLKDINRTTSCSVISTVVLNTLHACVIAFTAVLGILEPSHSFILFIFGWYSMWQIFMYCYFGHRIRALHASVLNAAYQSQWVHGSEISRSAAIMIATVASCPNSISQIGSPFFSLSMETFTSIVSVVISYFLVLLQFKPAEK